MQFAAFLWIAAPSRFPAGLPIARQQD